MSLVGERGEGGRERIVGSAALASLSCRGAESQETFGVLVPVLTAWVIGVTHFISLGPTFLTCQWVTPVRIKWNIVHTDMSKLNVVLSKPEQHETQKLVVHGPATPAPPGAG